MTHKQLPKSDLFPSTLLQMRAENNNFEKILSYNFTFYKDMINKFQINQRGGVGNPYVQLLVRSID